MLKLKVSDLPAELRDAAQYMQDIYDGGNITSASPEQVALELASCCAQRRVADSALEQMLCDLCKHLLQQNATLVW